MNLIPRKVRALGLCSGGLDSMLAGLVLRRQGIDVEWITFETPFFSSGKAKKASRICKIPLIVKDITPVYLKMLKNPSAGYGKYMNPCMDCHSLMFRLAGKIMKAENFDFLFSGEVLGQRPMSQTRPSLRYVEKNSGVDGFILRPLSAKRLPETLPEKNGLVKKELLLDFAGRSRKPQIKLAKEFNITDYPAPAGGCLLTDKGYSIRLKDLFDHNDDYKKRDLELLKYGRHFRLGRETKIIVGRTQIDNNNILKFFIPETDHLINVIGPPGPVVLMPGGGEIEKITLAATICAGYSKAPNNMPVDVCVEGKGNNNTLQVLGLPPKMFQHLLVTASFVKKM